MTEIVATYRSFVKHIKPVAFTHVVTLINAIFFVVIGLLLYFKEFHEALFLSFVVVLNIIVGIVQDMRAKMSLEKLQILMAPRIIRISSDGLAEKIELEDIRSGDLLQISLGDQVPSDGMLTLSEGLEVNEALLSGESANIQKAEGANVLAGSIVTAGNGLIRVTILPAQSFVSQMTERIKKYTYVLSPIQRTLTSFIRYMSYLLLAVIAYVTIHGISADALVVTIVKNIAALTSTLVPQGLILATTLFFAYGALKLFKKQVLLQEINATEKLGLIKNLCVDKTGTLTENQPQVESVVLADGVNLEDVNLLLSAYLFKNGNTSQTAVALQNFVPTTFPGTVVGAVAFSSGRKYGAVSLKDGESETIVMLGAPDVLSASILDEKARAWVAERTSIYASQAKRLVLIATANILSDTLEGVELSPLALYVLSNPLRAGTREIISFFQDRKVRIRVISGDHPETVRAIAEQAGVKHSDLVVTGAEMATWDDDAFEERVPAYHVFARVHPEQKEKIIQLLKRNGFTAMVGDGANDALAIKQADLGIAMFDGAGATRQIAQVVLMNNSFAALPTGVEIAETIITNIGLVAGVFFYKVATGFLVFAALAALGFFYPLSPRNDTIIGYSTVWLAITFWSLFPARKIGLDDETSFLKKTFPFALTQGLLSASAAILVYLLNVVVLHTPHANSLVVLVFMALGYWFVFLSPLAYGVEISHRRTLIGMGVFFAVGLIFVFSNPGLAEFFDLYRPGWLALFGSVGIICLFAWLEYVITLKFFFKGSEK